MPEESECTQMFVITKANVVTAVLLLFWGFWILGLLSAYFVNISKKNHLITKKE